MLKKVLALVLAVVLAFPQETFSQVGAGLKPASTMSSFSVKIFSIPESLGSLTASFAENSDKTVILIQDAHDSLEAQEHIAKIIQHLVETKGVRTVYEEGDQGKVGKDFYLKRIRDPKIREAPQPMRSSIKIPRLLFLTAP